MTESTTTPQRPSAPADTPPAGDREAGVFTWIRSLGFVRGDGWAGGLCLAVAERIGVDVLIVRGVAVVLTVLGFPLLWAYALAWALVPDDRGRIPLQMRAGSGPALLGVLGAVLLAIAHTALGTSAMEAIAQSSYPGRFVWELGGWLLGLSILGAVAAVVAWLVRRRRPARADLPLAGDDGGLSGTAAVSGGATSGVAPPPSSAPEPPEPLSALASAAELDAWREQHAAWREQHEQWRRRQADGDQAAAAEARARLVAERAAFRAEAARLRAERRAAKPRTSVSFVVIALGTALLAGVGVWFAFQPYASERAIPAAFLSAAAAVGLAMVLAGALRRRSGFLAAVAIVLLAVGGTGALAASFDELVPPGAVRYPPQGAYEIVQPFGALQLEVGAWDGGDGVTTVEKGSGETRISVQADVDVVIEATLGDGGQLWVNRYGDDGYARTSEPAMRDGFVRWTHDGGADVPTRTIVLDQKQGDVIIDVWGN
ncbi:PspC domain-containing protein [Microbacterium marinilacus]|uniref:Phage shock protein PspC N-terminal domain-containing protein n=1 Tax=Microbacterium marinilacus TaxID=415209 RepID=A0ABP7BE08_9MICO|nr:PspC domain-containing protein [Microbacterium marinilacus]MBY0686914.1 PspC domain-containing protein [Microbacterium marinilacus]